MLTLAAAVNNLKDERNDYSLPASLTYRISYSSSLTFGFKHHCHLKIPLSFIRDGHRVLVEPNESLHRYIECVLIYLYGGALLFSLTHLKMSPTHCLQTQRWLSLLCGRI